MNKKSKEEKSKIHISGIEIELREKRIKNIYIRVKVPEGKVIVSAPVNADMDLIRNFVINKLDWIKSCQQRIKKVFLWILSMNRAEKYCFGEKNIFLKLKKAAAISLKSMTIK